MILSGNNNGYSVPGAGTFQINPGATVIANNHNVFGHTINVGTNTVGMAPIVINGGTLLLNNNGASSNWGGAGTVAGPKTSKPSP